MQEYVIFTFHTGECRMEKVTPKRPAALIALELVAKWGTRGQVKTAVDITDVFETAMVTVISGKPG